MQHFDTFSTFHLHKQANRLLLADGSVERSSTLNPEQKSCVCPAVVAEAGEKLHFQKEDLLYRIETFPVFLLKILNLTDEKVLDNFESYFKSVI